MSEHTEHAEAELTETEKDALWEAVERAFLDTSTYSKAAVLDAEHAVARIIAAREAEAWDKGYTAACDASTDPYITADIEAQRADAFPYYREE